jgi:heptosyltransferase-1
MERSDSCGRRPSPFAAPAARGDRAVNAIIVVRPSSLGDVVHALALVADVRAHRPDLAVDWVAEVGFVPLVELHPGIRRVIPVALRRWRRHLLAAATWSELASFRRELRRERYAAVLDLQEQIKGALIARIARGVRHGPDRASIREPIATLAHDVHHAIDPNQHLIDRCRQLAAAALGYRIEGPPRFGLVPPQAPSGSAQLRPYVVLVHGTSRADKRWADEHWRRLIARFAAAGLAIVLPWGSAEELARSEALAAGIPDAQVPPPPRLTLPALAGLLARAELVVGVDTGLVHLAAALGTPTIALFVTTDPLLCGVGPAGRHARDLGGVGSMPTPDAVEQAAEALMQRTLRC